MRNFWILISVCVLGLSLSACQKKSKPGAGESQEDYKGDAVKGDWRVEWLTANPEGLNPIVGNDGYAQDVYQYIFDSLVTYDIESGEPMGRLAESWTVSPDGLTYDFKLRKDVLFHDGKPFTAEDVKFTFDKVMDPKTDAASLRNYFEGLKEVIVVSPHEVKLVLKKVYYRNLITFGTSPIIPKHIYGVGEINKNPKNRAPVGTGPYEFESWDTGQKIVLKRAAKFWGINDPYYKTRYNFEKIVFKVITDQNVAALALKKGDIDVMEPTATMYLKDFAEAEFQKSHYRLKYSTEDGNGFRYIGWNFKVPLFQSKNVRWALAYLMPRDEINSRMFEDLLTPAIGPIPTGSSKIDANLKPIPYDKAKAEALLKEDGWTTKDKEGFLTKNGKRFKFELLFASGSSEGERFALIYQQALKEAGIDMSIKTLEWTVFLKQRAERKFDALMMSWGSSLDSDPYQIWHSSQEKDQGSNAGSYANKRVDEILEKARVTMDRAERNKLYQEFSRLIYEDQPYLFLFERPFLFVGTKRFANVLPTGKLGLDGSRWFTPPAAIKYAATPVAP